MDCTTLVNPPIQDVVWCAFRLAAGSEIIAAVFLFCLLIYAMYTFRVPVMSAGIIMIMLLFAFAGAGVMAMGLVPPLFTNLLWIAVMLFGVIVVFAFWRLRQ